MSGEIVQGGGEGGFSIFLLPAWLIARRCDGHIRQLLLNHDRAPNNAGIFLVAEIVTPLVILGLALKYAGMLSMIAEAQPERIDRQRLDVNGMAVKEFEVARPGSTGADRIP